MTSVTEQGPTAPCRLTAWVHGEVQGVGFRWWTRARALELGLAGSASNLLGSLPAAQLSGNWVNANQNLTQGITKIDITNNGTKVTVHPFSKCSPADCDWGTKSSEYTGSPFNIVFVVNGSTESLAISRQGPQLMVVDTSSTNGTHTYLFDKG